MAMETYYFFTLFKVVLKFCLLFGFRFDIYPERNPGPWIARDTCTLLVKWNIVSVAVEFKKAFLSECFSYFKNLVHFLTIINQSVIFLCLSEWWISIEKSILWIFRTMLNCDDLFCCYLHSLYRWKVSNVKVA